ncbi:hypothetical protein KJ567_02500, partial [Candidatus Bipolaricaulota bacterium]|nr:hypothetical protein [Candidatus Bipolaricaulota bacterium]
LKTADSNALSARSRRLAEQLANATFDQLVAHWSGSADLPHDSVPTEDGGASAGWPDLAVAARALRAGASALSAARSQAVQLLDQLGRLANQAGSLDEPIDEAARLLVLVIAADDSSNGVNRVVDLRNWDILEPRSLGDVADRLLLGSRSLLGWPDTPRQLAILFDFLSEVSTADPAQRDAALAAADVLLAQHVVASRVQLAAPSGYWLYHTEVGCFDLAPVFAVLRGRSEDVGLFDYR